MDILSKLNEQKAADEIERLKRGGILRMICPAFAPTPNDDVLVFRAAEKVADLVAELDGKTVLMFADDEAAVRLLEMYVSFRDVFDHDIVVVSGVPGAEYPATFDHATWMLDRVGYHSLVADALTEAQRAAAVEAERTKSSIYEQERDRYTRANNTVKEFTAFEAPDVEGLEVPDDNRP